MGAGIPAPARPPEVDHRAAELLTAAMTYADGRWDERAGLMWGSAAGPERQHDVRGTAAYAYGLLLRDQPGDRARALRAVDVILGQQIRDPGQPWDGTFFRTPEEPAPTQFSHRWENYDPNWRQFIGTALALCLIDFGDRLPPSLEARIDDALRRAVEGELHEARLTPAYTNIAVMHAFLWTFAGERLHRPDWVAKGEAWAQAVHAGFQEHGTFEEYNSPTYYGVDLYGLALWRRHGPTDVMRRLGADLEGALWRDIAAFYHAGLRNMAGPYDRAYGMDMCRYVTGTGVLLRMVLDAGVAPLPDLRQPSEHDTDLMFAPLVIGLGVQIPADAMAHFQHFQGERTVSRTISSQRVATAWLGTQVMIGGEATSLSRGAGPASRTIFHPATIHWRTPDGRIGWIDLHDCPRVDARAAKDSLTVKAIGDSTFRLSAPGLTPAAITRDRWDLAGLTVRVETDAASIEVTPVAGAIDVCYRAATKFVLGTSVPQGEPRH